MRGLPFALCFGFMLIAVGSRSLAAPAETNNNPQISQTEQDTRNSLEIRKLREEIVKLQIDRRMAYIAPLASLGSIFMLGLALIVQRSTSLKLQDRAERTNFELKIADLVMTSYSPSAAQNRLSLLTSLYRDRIRPNFANSFNADQFPGIRRHEMLIELFKQMAGKCTKKEEIIELFRQVFPNERAWWYDAQFPPLGDSGIETELPAKHPVNKN